MNETITIGEALIVTFFSAVTILGWIFVKTLIEHIKEKQYEYRCNAMGTIRKGKGVDNV